MTDTIVSGFRSTTVTMNGADNTLISGTLQTTNSRAIDAVGFNNTISITGTVTSFEDSTIVSTGGSARVVISSTGLLQSLNDFSNGALFFTGSGTGSFLANHGEIIGNNGAVVSGTSTNNTLYNAGTITGLTNDGIAIFDGSNAIINDGRLAGADSGILVIGATGTTIKNQGDISGAQGITVSFSGTHEIVNSGTITGFDGDAILSSTQVTVVNAGLIVGNVKLGAAADTFIGQRDGHVTDKVLGQGGNDILRGAWAEDVFEGGGGGDVLRGGRGDDVLRGGSGSDLIAGGRDDDLLTGGKGADIFVFKRTSGEDEITDFQNNFDVLDLSALDAVSRTQLVNKGAIKGDGSGGSVILLDKIGGEGTIAVEDMSVAQWTNADFIF